MNLSLLLSLALILPSTIDSDSPKDNPYVGRWESSFGLLVIEGGGDAVIGRYPLGTLSGRVIDDRLTFQYEEAEETGEGWFELAEGGKAFQGKYRVDGSEVWLEWRGERDRVDFDGLWETTFGRMKLQQVGDSVTGSYALGGGATIEGTADGATLRFQYAEPAVTGEGEFNLDASGESFEGRWRMKGSNAWHRWEGRRIDPEPGVVWLVILEAHWELSLVESEYAFGDMLQSYFTMASARHVRTRHRFFHDAVDLKRFAREVAYLAEPVVLVISSHGTESGVQVAGATLDADTIRDAVRDLAGLRLLHLSGCSMMKGDVPRSVIDGLPPSHRFPISGYSTPVAWDASAIADFTFLSMVLIRGLDPAEAVRQTHKAAPFTGSESIPGCVVRPLGLDVLTPDQIEAKEPPLEKLK
ncbi:MAG: hypothetical protein AAF488_09100 [Planctomycetota bacterium]